MPRRGGSRRSSGADGVYQHVLAALEAELKGLRFDDAAPVLTATIEAMKQNCEVVVPVWALPAALRPKIGIGRRPEFATVRPDGTVDLDGPSDEAWATWNDL